MIISNPKYAFCIHKLTGNGNEMFIPESGQYIQGSELSNIGDSGFACFMSSSYSDRTYYQFSGNEYGFGIPAMPLYIGVPIRAVCVPE